MSGRVVPRAHFLASLFLAALAGCQESTDSAVGPQPQFAQGDNGIWTVNSLLDPGVGGCDDVECTLREAIAAAASGDRIGFAGGLQGGRRGRRSTSAVEQFDPEIKKLTETGGQ